MAVLLSLFVGSLVLSLFVPYLFLFLCLGTAVLRDCDIFRVS